MVPVQLKVLTSCCCPVSQASALLERFLSSDACSDSFARDYVASVHQALHERGGLEHCHLPACVDVRQTLGPTDEKQGLAEDIGQDALDVEVGSALPGAKGASSVGNAQRRGLSAGENGRETVPPSSPSETNYNRKKRAKEKYERESLYHGADDQKVGDKRKRKEEQETETENAVTEYTAPDSQSLLDRKRRKKRKQRPLTEDMESIDNRGSLVSRSVDENLGMKAASKADKKVELSRRAADFSVVRPLLSNLEKKEGSLERKEEENLFLCVTPLKVPLLEKNRAETEGRASEETAKKKRRKKEHHELIRQALSG